MPTPMHLPLERGQEGAGYATENFPVFNGESV